MRATYQEITDKMRAAFFDACGEKPEDLPELDTRFRSVATELYALSVFGDHVQSQVFADTARGADLDRHAADVGLQRKGASAAAGVLTFSLAQAAEAAVTVPADTVCSVAGQPYLQFATTKAATIPAGEWTVDVPAVSLGKTTAHNVEPGCITVMVNPPAGIRGGDQRQSVFGRRGGRNGYRPAPKNLSGATGAAQWGEHRLLGRSGGAAGSGAVVQSVPRRFRLYRHGICAQPSGSGGRRTAPGGDGKVGYSHAGRVLY